MRLPVALWDRTERLLGEFADYCGESGDTFLEAMAREAKFILSQAGGLMKRKAKIHAWSDLKKKKLDAKTRKRIAAAVDREVAKLRKGGRPSKASLKAMPEIDPRGPKSKPNPYAKRIAKKGGRR